MEPLLGIREWRVRNNELYGPWIEDCWPVGHMKARCIFKDSTDPHVKKLGMEHPFEMPVPYTGCQCGIYAFYKEPKGGRHCYSCGKGFGGPQPCACGWWLVRGVIQAWGRVELHLTGFRAEYARPVLFKDTGGGQRAQMVATLAERYQCKVVRNLPHSKPNLAYN